MRHFLIALQFLTILPVRIKSDIKETDYARALLYFPIIGGLIGIVLSAVVFIFSFLPTGVVSILVLALLVIVTGGIHLDGFADTCDGFYGQHSRDEVLKIMRDSRIGVMGVIGIVLLLLFKFTLIHAILKQFFPQALIMMVVLARWSQALSCFMSKYARSEGKARFFMENVKKKDVIFGGLFSLGLFLLAGGLKGIFLLGTSLLPGFIFIHYAKRKINGMTGDTIGAVSEITEVGTLLFIVLYFSLWR